MSRFRRLHTRLRMAARAIRAYPRSMAGQLALVLSIGMAGSALIALKVADTVRLERQREEEVAATFRSAVDIAGRLRRDPGQTGAALAYGMVLGAHAAHPAWRMDHDDPDLSHRLSAMLGYPARVARLPNRMCWARLTHFPRAAGIDTDPLPQCWFIEARSPEGATLRYAVDLLSWKHGASPAIGSPYLELILIAGALLGLLAASIATAPLRRMERAARELSLVGEHQPIPVAGPNEVRAALATFNRAQDRVREGLRERTQILASVTHDLQTPLTRLRLRLEQVEDEALRARLVADLAVMQTMVRDGLDLARSSELREAWSVIDIDSLLSSQAEDAAEFGHAVRFEQGCGQHVRAKPHALVRVLGNLIDNAVKYGGGAELSARCDGRRLVITVSDRGPGIPPALLAKAFEPFRRLSGETAGGSGIGLAIAQALAATFEARVVLANRPGGGLDAAIVIPIRDTAPSA